jgi:hypothetical protein
MDAYLNTSILERIGVSVFIVVVSTRPPSFNNISRECITTECLSVLFMIITASTTMNQSVAEMDTHCVLFEGPPECFYIIYINNTGFLCVTAGGTYSSS